MDVGFENLVFAVIELDYEDAKQARMLMISAVFSFFWTKVSFEHPN